MFTKRVPTDSQACVPVWALALAVWAVMLSSGTPLFAQTTSLPPITVGAGVRTSFAHLSPDDEDSSASDEDDESTDTFALDSVRLYVGGSVTNTIKLTFNTEYNGATNDVAVMDAIAQLEFSPRFNVWFGRFLPPSDRANLYGPYYAHHWSVYTDGVQDGYPMIFQGRDNGAAYWGQFGKVKVSAGAFDGASATGDKTVIGAGRVQVDFWDPEPGYYLNGTFYGDRNILAVAAAGQVQGSDKTAYNFDFLLERKMGAGGALSVEAEWAKYDGLGGYNSRYDTNDGGYFLGSYLFPTTFGVGRFEALAKYAHARFRDGMTLLDVDYDQDTTELNFNYVIKQFNARVMVFFKDTRFDAVRTDFRQFGVGMQIQI